MGDQTIGDRLVLCRSICQLSQLDMAEKMDLAPSTLKKIEKNGNVPNGDTLLKYAALGFNPGWILTGMGPVRLDELAQAGSGDPTSGDTAIARPVNAEALTKCVELVEEWLAQNKRSLAADRKAHAVVLIYQIVMEDLSLGKEPIDSRRVGQFLRLVA